MALRPWTCEPREQMRGRVARPLRLAPLQAQLPAVAPALVGGHPGHRVVPWPRRDAAPRRDGARWVVRRGGSAWEEGSENFGPKSKRAQDCLREWHCIAPRRGGG